MAPVLAATVIAMATSAWSQSYSSSGVTRRSSGTHDFPTWERDVSPSDTSPLPVGKPGHFVAGPALELGGVPVGVVAVGGGLFAAAVSTGGLVIADAQGKLVTRVETPPNVLAPIAIGESVVVSSATGISRIGRDGVLWSHDVPSGVATVPAAGLAGLAVASVAGTIEVLDAATGDRRAITETLTRAAALAVLREVVIAALADGTVVGIDAASGATLWRASIGDAAESLIADEQAAWVGGRGASSRTRKDVAPVIARLPLGERGRKLASGRDWKLRVGGDCEAQPVLLDDVVAFACHDGYVHAVSRKKGVGGWRVDLPEHAHHAPLLAGERLDFVLDQSRYVVALGAQDGAVMGWSELSDEDEIFVGQAAWGANVTAAGTNLGRLVTMTWAWDETKTDENESADDGAPKSLLRQKLEKAAATKRR
jgi:outer membrane protein assembly factor BamB